MIQEPLSSEATTATSVDATDETIAPAVTESVSNSIGNETNLVNQTGNVDDEDEYEEDEDSKEDEDE